MNNQLTQKFEIKSDVGEQGTFKAYGNVFNVIDSANDMTISGTFLNSIAEHKANETMPKLLAQHGHTTMPIGIITDMGEDEHGLYFEGKFALGTQAGAEAYELVKMGAISEFSIGYVVKQFENQIVSNKQVRTLLDVDVKEISLVTFACNPESKVISVKSALESGEQVTTRMVQGILRESGLSKRQSENAINQIKSQDKESILESKNETQTELEDKIDDALKVEEKESDEVLEEKEMDEDESTEKEKEETEVKAEKPSTNKKIETKGGYWMEECLDRPVISYDCFMDVFYYLSPTAHAKMFEIAEEDRKAQLTLLNPVMEEKSEDLPVGTSKIETEIETKSEISQDDIESWFKDK